MNKTNTELIKDNRKYIEQNRYEYPNCPHPAVDRLEDVCARLEAAEEKIEQLQKQLMEHGETLMVFARLRQLYRSNPNMKEPQVESVAKCMIKQAEEGLRIAHQRRQEEYIKQLQAKIEQQQECIRKLVTASNKVSEMLGHNHWAETQRHGAGCVLCIKQGKICNEIKAAIAKAEELIK